MTRQRFRIASCGFVRVALRATLPLLVLLVGVAQSGSTQAVPYERTYRQSKSAVEILERGEEFFEARLCGAGALAREM